MRRLSLAELVDRTESYAAELQALVDSARAVVVSFEAELDAGTLRPARHASLRLLEQALLPFTCGEGSLASLQQLPGAGRPTPTPDLPSGTERRAAASNGSGQ